MRSRQEERKTVSRHIGSVILKRNRQFLTANLAKSSFLTVRACVTKMLQQTRGYKDAAFIPMKRDNVKGPSVHFTFVSFKNIAEIS